MTSRSPLLLRVETTERRRGVTGFDEEIGVCVRAAKLGYLSKLPQNQVRKTLAGFFPRFSLRTLTRNGPSMDVELE